MNQCNLPFHLSYVWFSCKYHMSQYQLLTKLQSHLELLHLVLICNNSLVNLMKYTNPVGTSLNHVFSKDAAMIVYRLRTTYKHIL